MGEAENSWEEVTAAYRGALDRGHGYGASLDEWQQRQALAGGVLLSKDSPFVRLEATLRDGVWSRNVSGGAMVSEGEPLRWSKAPSEEVPFASRPLREPKYSIPSEKELELAHAPSKITYASSRDQIARQLDQLKGKTPSKEVLTEEAIQAATGMSLEERQALRLREAKEWTDAGKHVGSKPRTTLPGESAMSVREVDGRRQIDVWTVEPHGTVQTVEEFGKEVDKWVRDGWVVSVNGEEVGRVGSLNEAKALAQAEATKRLGVAPTVREVAAEAVTPPPAGASTRSALTNRADELNEQLSRALDEGGFIADDGSGDILLDLSDLEARKSYSPEMRDLLDEIDEVDRLLAARSASAVTPAETARFADEAAEEAAEAVTPPPAAADLGPLTPDEVRLQVDITSEVEGTAEGAYDIYLLTHKSGARVREVGLGDFVYLDDLFVPEAHRGRGIARGMMMDLIDMHTPVLAHDSARGVYLHSQDELLPFYRSLGFELAPKDDPGWRLAGDDQNLMWFHARGEAAPGLTRIGDEAAAEAVTPPAGGPVWRDLAGHKKGDAYELVADLNASEGALLPQRRPSGEITPTMFRIRRSKGKAGGWSVWYKQEGFEKFEKVADGGNVRVPAKSNPDKTVAVPGVWETLEDAKAHVDSLVGDAPTVREVAAEAVTPHAVGPVRMPIAEGVTPSAAAAAAAESVPISFFDDMREVGMPDPRLDPDTPRFGDVATDNVEGFATWEDFVEDIRQRGIRNPIRVGKDSTTGELVGLDGNHRLQAARQLGMDEVPVVVEERAVTELAAAPTSPPAAATRAPDPSGMYGPKGAPRFDEAIVRTPFGDFRLRFVGKRTGQGVEILDAPSGLMASPAKTGGLVPGTRAPLGPGVKFKNYAAAESRIDGWAQEVFENRWTGAEAQGAVGATFLDPARQGGVRQALATLTGRTETTGFPGGIEEGLSWLDEPMWRMPLERRMAFTEAERDVLIQAERLSHLAYASEHYRAAEAAMRTGLTVEAEIAAMQGRLRQLQGEQDMATAVYEAAGANLREPGGRKDLAHQGLAPKDVAELFDGTRTDMDYFQAALRKFNTSRGKDLFDKSLTQQTAAQWGPNSVDPKWSRGWSAPLGDGGGEAAPVFEMLNALFKTSSSSGDFGAFLKWYDKFLNYWKAQAVSTPGFVIRNGLGGSWLSYAFGLMELGSTNKFAGVFFKASKLGEGNAVKGVDEMIAALGVSKKKSVGVGFGSRVDINELRTIRRVLDSGIVGGGQVITEVDRNVAMRLVRESRNPITNQPIDVVFNPASTEFAPFRFIRSSNEQMETVLRGALAFDVLQKGGSVADAAGQVYKFHFNYADLTSMERKMRRIIPFWTWQKNVVPILVESLGKHPYAWGRLQQVKGNLELQSKEEGVVPDYFLENMAIRLPWKINDYQSYWIPDLPFRDLNRLMKEPGSITRVFAESAAPPVKVPLEIWAGKQFFADLPFSGRYQQVPHVYAKFPFLMDALSLAGKAKKDKKGEYKMRDQDLYMMDSWMPFLSRFRRLLPNESRYSRRVASTVVSTVFGTQVRVNDPHETRNQIIRNDRAFDEKMRDLIDIEMRVR
jgi:GNAT superfamily N-acetyltransferase